MSICHNFFLLHSEGIEELQSSEKGEKEKPI